MINIGFVTGFNLDVPDCRNPLACVSSAIWYVASRIRLLLVCPTPEPHTEESSVPGRGWRSLPLPKGNFNEKVSYYTSSHTGPLRKSESQSSVNVLVKRRPSGMIGPVPQHSAPSLFIPSIVSQALGPGVQHGKVEEFNQRPQVAIACDSIPFS